MSRLRVTANSRDAALRAAQRARQPALTERVDDVVTAEELVSRDEPGELAYGQDPLAAVAGAGEHEGEDKASQIDRANDCTPVTNVTTVCRILLEKKKTIENK